ncbi:MAG: asparagine synthase (glutamine-hydrolyzing) [Acidobacteriota bacterium]
MCGIAGIISSRETTLEDLMRIAAMSRAQIHRGPNGSGEYHSSHVILAARRLSIIDLEGGHQPLYNEDRSLALVANGEIYNYVDLRVYLERLGHRFHTQSDCETILHAYEEDGVDCLHYLRGMFAFALWDERRRRLFVARDPMGEKPLYLFERDGLILFASEMKALLRSGLVSFELDPSAIDYYFHYQYVPEPRTAITDVRKLPAAHYLTVDLDQWNVNEKCYWRMEDARPIEGDAPALIRQELDTIGRLLTRSDTPVGVALSSGLDSGAVAAIAAPHLRGQLHAFTVGYEGRPAGDERLEARDLADHLGFDFHEVEINTAEVVEFFSELQFWRDDPVADYAGHSYYALTKLAREHGVPVVLQGQGGDELFWGYPQLRQAAHESIAKQKLSKGLLRALPHYVSLNRPADFSAKAIADWTRDWAGVRSGLQRMRNHRAAPADQLVFYDVSRDFSTAAGETTALYTRAFTRRLGESDVTDLFTFPRPWPGVDVTLTRLISDTYLRGNGIAQGDRLSMASSVEMRLPLLDRKLVEAVIGLRKTQSDVNLPPKEWLRQAITGLVPNRVLNRPKRGFAPPVAEWHEAIFAVHGPSLRDGYLSQVGVLRNESADRLANGPFPAGLTSPVSFKALVLEHWCRRMSAVVDEAPRELGGNSSSGMRAFD